MLITHSFEVQSKSRSLYIDSLKTVKTDNPDEHIRNLLSICRYYSKVELKTERLYLDSVSFLINNSKDSISRLNYYSLLRSYYTQTGDMDSAYFYAYKSINICKEMKYDPQIGKEYNNLATYFYNNDGYDSAIFYFNKAMDYYRSLDTSKLEQPISYYLAGINITLGSLYINKGDYDKGLNCFYNSLKLWEKEGDKFKQAKLYNNIGSIFTLHHEYDKALSEYKKGLKIALEFGNHQSDLLKATLLNNMGNCYKGKDSLDTALEYYYKSLEIRKRLGPKISEAGLNDNIGNIKKARGDYKGALENFQIALKIRKKGKSKRGLASSYGNIGLLYAKMGENKKAIPYLKRAIEIADSNSFVEISLVCTEGLSIVYSNLGSYKKAFDAVTRYYKLKDSIHSVKFEEKLNLYKEKYETEKKDRLIQKLEEDQKIADLNIAKQEVIASKQKFISNSLAIVAGLLLFVLFIIYRYFKMKQRADREMMLKNEQINQQKTLDLMKEQEVSTIKSYMEGQEKERSRIAGDLHDRLGSLLSTVKLHLSSLEQNLHQNEEAQKSFDYVLSLIDTSVEEVRSVSRNLSKGVLTQFGLFAAVESMRDAINSANKIKMQVIQSGTETRLNPEVEISLFRIIQELITNVIRHAQTNEIFVQFVGSDDRLNIIVEDHGIGFNPDEIKSNGIGLSNLKKRVEEINGEFSIDSELGEGTTIIIDIPYITAS